VEVDTAAISRNARSIQRLIGERTSLMAVVKADGYGHGAVAVARAALQGGAASLGVATLAEGVELRQEGIQAPVLVLGNLTQVEELRSCLRWQLHARGPALPEPCQRQWSHHATAAEA
jgi:alanine racemase